MHIRPTRVLKVGPSNAKYNLEGKVREEYSGADWGDNSEIEEAMAANDNKDDDQEDSQEKNR